MRHTPPPTLQTLDGTPPVDPYSVAPGVPLVFFDARRKVTLTGHGEGSAVYGNQRGGAILLLDGGNFAPLGEELQCIFGTPLRVVGNDTFNESRVTASFISPTRISCDSPDYDVRIGPTYVYVNTTFNSSLFDEGNEVRQTVEFIYYDSSRPPDITEIDPPHAPISGRHVRFEGGGGPWGQYVGSEAVGGILLRGSNFAPTRYLWCAFGMPEDVYATSRGPWKWTRAAFLNATAVRCEVPPGFVGDFPVGSYMPACMHAYLPWCTAGAPQMTAVCDCM